MSRPRGRSGTEAHGGAEDPEGLGIRLRRTLGAALVVLTLTPVFVLLEGPETGLPGARAVSLGWSELRATWWGGITVLGSGLALAILLPLDRVRTAIRRTGSLLRRARPVRFALILGALAAFLAFLASHLLFAGLPTLEDGMATLVHARYLAEGRASGSLPGSGAGWLVPNTLVTPEGWISQYPPLHVLLLAGGLRLGAPWIVGPLLLGVTVTLTTRIGDLLLPEHPATARAGAILAALSPFLVFLGGGYLSHTSAAAFGALALYGALRAERGESAGWPLLVGLAAGGAVACRPWTGLALGVVLPAGLWALRGSPGKLPRRLALATAGGAPVAAALGAYNQHFFGHPLRFGYTAAFGRAHLPGFHVDPWGNAYGPLEALGYTAADLVSLGTHLLETPLPAVLVVGVGLMTHRPLPRGSRVLLAWALLPVAANLLYWHHGHHMGPRMLYEAAPAWCLLVMVTAVALTRKGSGAEDVPPSGGETRPTTSSSDGRDALLHHGIGPRFRDGLLVAFLLCLPAAALLSADRAGSHAWSEETLARVRAPELPAGTPALVFVHGAWPERISSRLMAAGMPGDSLETALRRNDVCALHRYADWRSDGADFGRADGGPVAPPDLDLRRLPDRPASLEPVEVASGYVIWRDPSRPWTPECRRQLSADRRGVVSLAPLLWQGDLPGIETGNPIFVRDLGPEGNRAVSGAYPERERWMYVPSEAGAPPGLSTYEETMRRVW